MNIVLFDDEARTGLLPLTFTRPVSELRVGILNIREKWEKHLSGKYSWLCEKYLRVKYPLLIDSDNILINGSVCPDEGLASAIRSLKTGQVLVQDEIILAFRCGSDLAETLKDWKDINSENKLDYRGEIFRIRHAWHIFSRNEQSIETDFRLLTRGRKSQAIPSGNSFMNGQNIFLEEGAKVECAVLNANTGYIYLGKDSEIMEGSMIRGSFSLGEHSQLKMGAKIYGATTIGPHSKVGGEVSNSVISGYSNKAHDGFLGNSVIGEWCNLGADSNNSNLKNNYSTVKIWSFEEENYINSGLQFCGLIMGDHSKCSINTMFNTGTVVGVSANIFGTGFPPKYIPSFSWGGSEGFATYRLEEAMEVAQRVFERRKMEFDRAEQDIFRHLFDATTIHRAW